MTRLIEINSFKAYAGTPALGRLARALNNRSEAVDWWGLPPRVLFHVDHEGTSRTMCDPVEVRRFTDRHPGAVVSMSSVV